MPVSRKRNIDRNQSNLIRKALLCSFEFRLFSDGQLGSFASEMSGRLCSSSRCWKCNKPFQVSANDSVIILYGGSI